MNISDILHHGAAVAAAAQPSTGSSSSTSGDATISANDFLTLLVSELKNQDPTQNSDPNEYVDQLVQVNSLQQLISINQGIGSLDTGVSGSSGSGGSPSTGSGAGTSGAAGQAAGAAAVAPPNSDADALAAFSRLPGTAWGGQPPLANLPREGDTNTSHSPRDPFAPARRPVAHISH